MTNGDKRCKVVSSRETLIYCTQDKETPIYPIWKINDVATYPPAERKYDCLPRSHQIIYAPVAHATQYRTGHTITTDQLVHVVRSDTGGSCFQIRHSSSRRISNFQMTHLISFGWARNILLLLLSSRRHSDDEKTVLVWYTTWCCTNVIHAPVSLRLGIDDLQNDKQYPYRMSKRYTDRCRRYWVEIERPFKAKTTYTRTNERKLCHFLRDRYSYIIHWLSERKSNYTCFPMSHTAVCVSIHAHNILHIMIHMICIQCINWYQLYSQLSVMPVLYFVYYCCTRHFIDRCVCKKNINK